MTYYERIQQVILCLREFSELSIVVRLSLAVLCGGLIGMERMFKHRPAGMRTHMLICLGAAVTTLTGQYLYLQMHQHTDMLRLGAQVISGIGFIGAGTILVTKNRRVRGLTTAAGLWTAAIIGLACGAGYYEGAIFTTVLVLIAEMVFSKLEFFINANTPEAHLYLQYEKKENLEEVLEWFRTQDIKLINLQITRLENDPGNSMCAICTLRLNRKWDKQQLRAVVSDMEGILALEEM